MGSLRKIRDRIHSVEMTRQMTSSMKIVAVSRLKRKHATFLEAIPFADEMNRVVRRLIRSLKMKQEMSIWKNNPENIKWPPLLNGNGQENRYMVVMITSDDGLSGTSSLQVISTTRNVIEHLKEQKKEVFVVAYGIRGADTLKRLCPDINVIVIHSKKAKEMSAYLNAERLTGDIIKSFSRDRFDVCLVVYNQFKSIVTQTPIVEQVIPNKIFLKENPWAFLTKIDSPVEQRKKTLRRSPFLSAIGGVDVLSSLKGAIFKTDLSGGKRSPYLYDYEPSELGILTHILPRYLTAYIYRVILEAEVSDNAARLMAMDNATRNAGDMLNDLDRNYRRMRQTRITTDIAEVSGGSAQGG